MTFALLSWMLVLAGMALAAAARRPAAKPHAARRRIRM
jgi:hypothetical protein